MTTDDTLAAMNEAMNNCAAVGRDYTAGVISDGMSVIKAQRALIERQAAEIARLRDPWRPIDDEARNGEKWALLHSDGRCSAGRHLGYPDSFSVIGGAHWPSNRVTLYAPLPQAPTADKEG